MTLLAYIATAFAIGLLAGVVLGMFVARVPEDTAQVFTPPVPVPPSTPYNETRTYSGRYAGNGLYVEDGPR